MVVVLAPTAVRYLSLNTLLNVLNCRRAAHLRLNFTSCFSLVFPPYVCKQHTSLEFLFSTTDTFSNGFFLTNGFFFLTSCHNE